MAKKKIQSEEIDEDMTNEDEKPNFEDPDDYVDDVEDEGKKLVLHTFSVVLTRGFSILLPMLCCYLCSFYNCLQLIQCY